MNPATVRLIVALLPIATDLLIKVGDRVISLKDQGVTPEDLIQALEESKSESWPKLTFKSE